MQKNKKLIQQFLNLFSKKIPLPPTSLRFMNEDDERFKETGDEIVADLHKFANLNAYSVVADLGCGYGRVAHALLRSSQYYGQYLGIDILSRHIQWCKETLSPCAKKNSSIKFLHLDVKNNRYNPQGKLSTQDADFGLQPKGTDVILLTSVFTHMYEDEILEYLHKIKSALSPEGRVLATVFLLNDSWATCEKAGLSAYPMPYELNKHCRYKDEKDPLHAIGYSQDWFFELIKKAELKLESDPILGKWCGRKDGYRWQDILILSHN